MTTLICTTYRVIQKAGINFKISYFEKLMHNECEQKKFVSAYNTHVVQKVKMGYFVQEQLFFDVACMAFVC